MKPDALQLHLTLPDDILLYGLHCCTKCVLIKTKLLSVRLNAVCLFPDINKEKPAICSPPHPHPSERLPLLIDSDSRDSSPGLMLGA